MSSVQDPLPVRGASPCRIPCRGRSAREDLTEPLPHCLKAHAAGRAAILEIENLEGLGDSVNRLLKAFDRLAADFGAVIKIADSSGLGEAFLRALAGTGHVDVETESFR